MINRPDQIIGPTPERLAKAGEDIEVFETDSGRRTLRLMDGSILDQLEKSGVITADQYNAGCQICSDFYYSGLSENGTIDPARIVVDGGNKDPTNERKMAALTRYAKAIQHLGLIHSHVITNVVLLGLYSREEYAFRRWGQKSPKLAKLATNTALINALEELDGFYYGRREVRMRQSAVEGSRPEILAADQQGIE
jgi:hypothetical protein